MRITAAPVALATLLLLAGCGTGAGPATSPTPRDTASTSPTPSATPDAEEPPAADRPDRISIDTTVLFIGGPGDAEVLVFDYFQPVGAAVEALTEVFGHEPDVGADPGNVEVAPSTAYDWGGLVLHDPDGTGHAPATPDFWVQVTAPEVSGIPIFTHVAIQVGTRMSDVAAVQDGFFDYAPHSYVAWIFSQPIDPADVGEPEGSDLRIFVAVHGPAGGGGTVQEIVAPSINFGT